MPSRVVKPETKRLELSGGDWILVWTRLNHGQQQDAFARQYMLNAFGGHSLNLRGVDMAKVTSYLVDWNLTAPDDTAVLPLKSATGDLDFDVMAASLNAIDPESFAEIHNAIEAHETAMKRDRDAKKKTPPGAPASSATSASPEPATAPSGTPTSDS